MSRKLFAASFFAALAIGILLLLGLSDDVSATTVKLSYTSALDCGGADANEGATADNSCSTAGLGGRALGATADVQTIFDIKVGHSNYGNTRTVLASPAFNIALDSAIPNGTYVGYLTTTATIALLNGPCQSPVPITIPLYDATTDTTNTIDWSGTGVNLTQDADNNSFADGVDKYPSFLNIMFSGQRPLARYYGYTNATAGSPPTQLNFVIFAPGVLQGTTNPGMPRPDQEINSSLGYINYVALNNPVLGSQTAPSSISDICSPLNTTTRLFGKTAGEGRSFAAVGNGELSGNCRGAQIGVDDDADTVVDDGCMVVNDKCSDGVDGDGDTRIDEYCASVTTGLYAARVRSTNPTSATSGVYGTGSHMAGAYLQSYRDADNDGIANEQDSCPYVADGRESGTGVGGACEPGNVADEDGDGAVNDGCPRVGTAEGFPSPNQCTGSTDDDSDGSANDGCPPIQKDTNAGGLGANNGVGDACETTVNCPGGDNDCDNDTFENRQDNCPLVANLDQADVDSNRCNDILNSDSPDDTRFNDGCPAVGAPETTCGEAACATLAACDNDSDGVANDGCPLRGGISEYCVVSVAGSGANDWGPCNDAIGDACDANPAQVDGDYDKDMPRVSVCIGAADGDTDGWCDDTEAALGSNPASNTSVPENAGIDYPMASGAPQSCSNKAWYSTGTDPIGDGAAIDDDGDTLVNAADPSCLMLSGACPSDDADCDGVVTGPGTLCDGIVPTVVTTGTAYQTPVMKLVEAAAATDACILFNDDDDWPGTWWDDINTVTVNDPAPCTGHTITVGEVGAYEGIKIVWTPAGCVPNGGQITVDFQAVVAGPLDPAGKAAPCRGPIWTDSSGNPVLVDNCATVYNPDQLNSDTIAFGKGDTLGDACDLNDDGDGLTDDKEWARGSDAKNPLSPFFLDLDGSTTISGGDSLALKAWINTSIATLTMPTQVCLP